MKLIKLTAVCFAMLLLVSSISKLEARGHCETSFEFSLGNLFTFALPKAEPKPEPRPQPVIVERRVIQPVPVRPQYVVPVPAPVYAYPVYPQYPYYQEVYHYYPTRPAKPARETESRQQASFNWKYTIKH